MLFLAAAAGILFLGNSNGAAAVQGADRTGGPVSNGFCGSCHAAGAFNPTMTLEILQDGNVVTTYQAGASYTMRIRVNAGAGAQVYGFQAVALLAGNVQAGSFAATAGTQVSELNNREYIEHSQRSNSNVFEIPWTAPATSQGEVKFYAASVAANNAAGSGGDGAVFLTNPVVLTEAVVATRNVPELATSLRAFPNPVADQLHLNLEVEATGVANVALYNNLGQPLWQRATTLVVGNNTLTYDLSHLPAGQYVLEMSNGRQASRTVILKK
jgi:hypothetical protein